METKPTDFARRHQLQAHSISLNSGQEIIETTDCENLLGGFILRILNGQIIYCLMKNLW